MFNFLFRLPDDVENNSNETFHILRKLREEKGNEEGMKFTEEKKYEKLYENNGKRRDKKNRDIVAKH